MKQWLTLVLVLALGVSAFAQGRGGFGRGGAGSMMLLGRTDVQKDLGLTPEQVTKLKEIQDKARTEMRALFQPSEDGTRPDFEALRPKAEAIQSSTKKQIEAIITADNLKRLEEISLQLSGNRVALRPDIQAKLGVTDAQKTQLKELQTKADEANQELRGKVDSGVVPRDQLQTIMTKNRGILNDLIGKILTEEQKTKLAALGGKPFAAEKQEENNQRGG